MATSAAASNVTVPDGSIEERLQKIKLEYELIGLSFTNNQVVVCTGLLSSEMMTSLQMAIKQAAGPDVKVYMIIK